MREDYNNPYVLNLSDLPDLKKYPVKTAGKAVKLGFPATLDDVALSGIRRMPLTVAVQDKNGKTIREGIYSVRLALKKSGATKLSGSLTAMTVNGIATFPDVKIDVAGHDCQFVATADGLESATSPTFRVGPGDGLLREWWHGRTDFSTSPEGTEILGRALECPVTLATNFSSRISGEVIPPQSGNYKFWVAGAGSPELWLGSDSSTAGKRKIAAVTPATHYSKWPHVNETESEIVTLAAGKKYYFEIRQWQSQRLDTIARPLATAGRKRGTADPGVSFCAAGKMILHLRTHDKNRVQ